MEPRYPAIAICPTPGIKETAPTTAISFAPSDRFLPPTWLLLLYPSKDQLTKCSQKTKKKKNEFSPTLERALEGLKCETAVHICYGYGIKANTDWKKTLGSEWRQYEEAFPKLQQSKVDIISLECQNSHVPMDLIELIRGKKGMVGAIEVASNKIETPEQVADTLRKALQFVDADKLYPSTNCGMAPLARDIARGKLNALSAGAAIVRQELTAS